MPAATRFAPVATDRGALTQSLLLDSTLQVLDRGLRGGANRPLARCLRGIRLALQHDSVQAAIRLIDQAWRTLPGDAEALAPIYGRLLSLDDREHDAALRLLNEIDVRDAEVAALTIHAYLRLRRPDDAIRHLDIALKECCLAPGELLAREAAEALRVPDLQVAGWVGLGPTLEFHGELGAGAFAESLEIRLGDQPLPIPPKSCIETVGSCSASKHRARPVRPCFR